MEKIKKLRKLIGDLNLDGYIVPKNDEFFCEYVPKSKDNLKFISNFSGSFGFALILKKKNYLFIDGRYALQANIQSGKEFDIINISKKLPSNMFFKENLSIGYDPKLHTEKNLNTFFKNGKFKLIAINDNLIKKIKKNKNNDNNFKKFFLLKDFEAGESSKSKINRLSNSLEKNKIDIQFISAPENVAWLLNIRGMDTKYSPIPNCYLIIDKRKNINLFCDLVKVKNINFNFKNIKIKSLKELENYLLKLKNKKFRLDASSCSIFFKDIIKKNNHIIEFQDPIYFYKSIKNKIEIKNTVNSHILDGVAVTKFLFWLKRNYKKMKISEIDAQNKLLKFRKKSKKFKTLSFPTISGSGPNGAIIHYNANSSSNRILKKGDIYLVDSGGQYNFGTTDVTRTISLDNNNKRIKNIYTRVLKGHIAVTNYKLNKNTTGSEIDKAARSSLRQIKLDYAHGTGHGVGYYLNVHEGPQAISRGNKIKLKEGMIISNEPGYYEKEKFGIRIENLIWVKRDNKNLFFENFTMVPIDKSLIDDNLLNVYEKKWLNNYHSKVFLILRKYMNNHELVDLKKACSFI